MIPINNYKVIIWIPKLNAKNKTPNIIFDLLN